MQNILLQELRERTYSSERRQRRYLASTIGNGGRGRPKAGGIISLGSKICMGVYSGMVQSNFGSVANTLTSVYSEFQLIDNSLFAELVDISSCIASPGVKIMISEKAIK